MALFMLQLAHGEDDMVEADAAGRTAAGEIVLERTGGHGGPERIRTYPAEAVTAVFRRGPTDSGTYTWIRQPPEGIWWLLRPPVSTEAGRRPRSPQTAKGEKRRWRRSW
ncbi:hypothetical protein [Streptomyces sp. NPDC046685]|uniref:hypothetical protein n=1 Tax=Streptomyces sp. NPDC046685 TaxID=3157202 RepID=UPI00340A8E76